MSELSPVIEQYITFRLSDKVLVSPLSLIEEVTDPLPSTAIAATQSWFLGLASKKGLPIPVSDLGDYALGKPSRYDSAAKCLIVARDSETIGLVVDEVIGLTEFAADEAAGTQSGASHGLPDSARFDDTPLGPLVMRVIPVQSGDQGMGQTGEFAAVIDLGRLLTQQRFIQIGLQATDAASSQPGNGDDTQAGSETDDMSRPNAEPAAKPASKPASESYGATI